MTFRGRSRCSWFGRGRRDAAGYWIPTHRRLKVAREGGEGNPSVNPSSRSRRRREGQSMPIGTPNVRYTLLLRNG